MDQQTITRDKKTFLQNDPLLVCGMLAVYGVCILGLIGATFWGLDRRNRKISADATATAFAIATQQANATATAVVRLKEQDQYEIVDRFNTNKNRWRKGSEDNEFWKGAITIRSGVYLWDIQEIKDSFFSWADFSPNGYLGDFDVYVDSKIKAVDGMPGSVCSGLVFRTASQDWEKGAYTFSVCNNSSFEVEYYEQEKWETISGENYSSSIQNHDWNRLEISARGDHFTFLINHDVVYEMADDRLEKGGMALFLDVDGEKPVSIWFDNFGLQTHH